MKESEIGRPVREFVAPPAPTGVAGRTAGGFAANGMTNTELGDKVEQALVEQLGWTSLLGDVRQGPFDVRMPDGRVVEVKSVTREAREYKIKPKKVEVERKLAAAQAAGLRPAVSIVVVDGERGWVYVRDGVGAFRLSPQSQGAWEYVGQVTV